MSCGNLTDSWVKCDVDSETDKSEGLDEEMTNLLLDAQVMLTVLFFSLDIVMIIFKQKEMHSSEALKSEDIPCSINGSVCRSTTKQSGLKKIPSPYNAPKPTDNTELMPDWSSTPEIRPRTKAVFEHPSTGKRASLSLRKTVAMKHPFLSRQFLQILIPSMIVTSLISFAAGFCIGKRVHQSQVA